ncbi:hypothetical protein GCM10020001_111000 [Nonomuraea salmonea]
MNGGDKQPNVLFPQVSGHKHGDSYDGATGFMPNVPGTGSLPGRAELPGQGSLINRETSDKWSQNVHGRGAT